MIELESNVPEEDLLRIGHREWVRLPDLLPDDPIRAKIDTGARTSAIHVADLDFFQRDGREWVRFRLHPKQGTESHDVIAEALVLEHRAVRSSNGVAQQRVVVETTLQLGERRYGIELTLASRKKMRFRMLLGRTAMAGRVLVDPGASYLLGPRPRRVRTARR